MITAEMMAALMRRFGFFTARKSWRVIAGIAGTIVLLLVIWWVAALPRQLFSTPVSTVLFDHNGRLLGAAVAEDGQWRFPLCDSVPHRFIDAVVCFEDKRFFRHLGVDPVALCRAFYINVKRGTVKSGGSTLTMQTIRMARGNRRRSIPEKIVEMLVAVRLELSMSKREILRYYASNAPFGGNVVGLEAASWRYFGCDPAKLSWAETAMLAVLPNSPSLVHPGRNRQTLREKRDRLLGKLCTGGVIDSSTLALSFSEPLPPQPFALPRLAPHLLDRFGKERGRPSGRNRDARVITTIDADLQRKATAIIDRHAAVQAGNGVFNAAAIIVDNRTMAVRAYVGNTFTGDDTTHGRSVDIITAPRSTGSILKPFLYAAMLESGELVPDQLIADMPIRIGGFSPQNYSRTFEGAVPAHRALARSLNVPAVTLLHDYTVDRFYSLLRKLGMTTLFRPASDYGLSLILGGAEGTLWDITGMYAEMAATLAEWPHAARASETGHPVLHYRDAAAAPARNPQPAYVYGPGTLWCTFRAMEEVNRPEEDQVWEKFTSSKRIAWKTGTSFGFRDAWAIGVTPSHTVGVWVGNASGEGRSALTGISSAAPLLFDIYTLFRKEAWFDCPEYDLAPIDICEKSGFRTGMNCTVRRQARVPPAGMRSKTCPYCRIIHCDSTLRYRVHSDCEQVAAMVAAPWFVLPPGIEWYYRKTHFDYRPLPPWRADCMANAPEKRGTVVSIIYPQKGNAIYIPVELSGLRGKTVFEAAHRDPEAVLHWHLDNEYLGSTRNLHQFACSPGPGRHQLVVVDEKGETAQREFTVLR